MKHGRFWLESSESRGYIWPKFAYTMPNNTRYALAELTRGIAGINFWRISSYT